MSQNLNPLDLAFLALEQPRNPMSVGAIQIYEIPEGYQGNYTQDLYKKLMNFEAGAPFNQRLTHPRVFPLPSWEKDEDFDLEYHVRLAAIPKPGSTQDLFDLVMRIHTRMLDRQRPLWEFYVIEGLEGNRFAVYGKLHHAMIDGIRGMNLLYSFLNEDPEAPLKTFWLSVDKKKKNGHRNPSALQKMKNLKKKIQFRTTLTMDLSQIIATQLLKLSGHKPDDSPVPFTAPSTSLNIPTKGARRLAVNTYQLSEIKALSKKSDSTINDILLVLCTGALQKFLKEKNGLPQKPLHAIVPISVASAIPPGNFITYVSANLATDLTTPKEQLAKIKGSIGQAKKEVQEVSPAASISFAAMGQSLLAVLSKLGISDRIPPSANLVISNIPGPKKPMYLGTAKMVAQYPLSVLPEAQALNITIVSYDDAIEISLFVCRDTVPDIARLSEYFDLTYNELQAQL